MQKYIVREELDKTNWDLDGASLDICGVLSTDDVCGCIYKKVLSDNEYLMSNEITIEQMDGEIVVGYHNGEK